MKKIIKAWYIYPILIFITSAIFPYAHPLHSIFPYMMPYLFSGYVQYLRTTILPLPKDKTKWRTSDYWIKPQLILVAVAFLFFGGFASMGVSIIIPIYEFFGLFSFKKIVFTSPWNSIIIFILYCMLMLIFIVLFLVTSFLYIKETGWSEKYWGQQNK